MRPSSDSMCYVMRKMVNSQTVGFESGRNWTSKNSVPVCETVLGMYILPCSVLKNSIAVYLK